MILRPPSPPSRSGALHAVAADAPTATVPAWLRRAVADPQSLAGQDVQDVAILAGAALGALDAVVRRQEPWAGAWRQRLALTAAAVTAKQGGRVEEEAALRDAVLLTRPGDDVGPAGRLLLAWRRLAARPAAELVAEEGLAAVLDEFGYAGDDEAAGDLAGDLRQVLAGAGLVGVPTGAAMAADRHGFGRAVGAWSADALLAQRLGWSHAVPLLGTEAALDMNAGRRRRADAEVDASPVGKETTLAKSLLAGQARAALRAIDLSAELGRRAERLLAVAPKLRAKGADRVIDRLLNEDALTASRGERNAGMSDRGLRRLFDRLVALDGVRELSGRTAFRIYGL